MLEQEYRITSALSFNRNVGNDLGADYQVLFCSPDFETSYFPREALHLRVMEKMDVMMAFQRGHECLTTLPHW